MAVTAPGSLDTSFPPVRAHADCRDCCANEWLLHALPLTLWPILPYMFSPPVLNLLAWTSIKGLGFLVHFLYVVVLELTLELYLKL